MENCEATKRIIPMDFDIEDNQMIKYERDLLEFLKKYPNKWHSFNTDDLTLSVIDKLLSQDLTGRFTVDWDTKQMYYLPKKPTYYKKGGAK